MKKLTLFCCFLFFLINHLTAQEFSFQMFFEDAEGNQDTLTIGYDINGSRDTINPDFGEENIAHIPFDEVFDVRITNQADMCHFNTTDPLFHTKKKIIKNECNDSFTKDSYFYFVVNIDIHAINWPVTVSWDKTPFDNQCLNGSFFGAWHPVFWPDMIAYYSDVERVILYKNETVTFTENYPDNWDDEYIESMCNYYLTEDEKLISTFYVGLADSTIFAVNVEEFLNSKTILFYPNPTSGILHFENVGISLKSVKIIDIFGKIQNAVISENTIDIKHLKNGIYFLKIISSNEKAYTIKVLKIGK